MSNDNTTILHSQDEQVHWMVDQGWTVTTQSPLLTSWSWTTTARAENDKGEVVRADGEDIDTAIENLYRKVWVMANVSIIPLRKR